MTLAFLFGGIEIIILLVILLPLFALISILNSEFEGNDKLIWILIVLFMPFLGAILYYIIGKNKRIDKH